ncbi:hypothetical protein EDS67_29525 [candidate division KSB1 bacterium]|nr:MAG: hypothetical protein EDS67_29525 [candidate division KSB1 bacterium]MBC6950686.1 hypothetical protein [candidate division KSB1 bacterium]MCE7945603.1 hypothetical protein [Chlorobi bacterium CHB1]
MSLTGFGFASEKAISKKWENAMKDFALLQNLTNKVERVGIRFGAPKVITFLLFAVECSYQLNLQTSIRWNFASFQKYLTGASCS